MGSFSLGSKSHVAWWLFWGLSSPYKNRLGLFVFSLHFHFENLECHIHCALPCVSPMGSHSSFPIFSPMCDHHGTAVTRGEVESASSDPFVSSSVGGGAPGCEQTLLESSTLVRGLQASRGATPHTHTHTHPRPLTPVPLPSAQAGQG